MCKILLKSALFQNTSTTIVLAKRLKVSSPSYPVTASVFMQFSLHRLSMIKLQGLLEAMPMKC